MFIYIYIYIDIKNFNRISKTIIKPAEERDEGKELLTKFVK
jgi:hypothetical protein